jgi:hypothetical protein
MFFDVEFDTWVHGECIKEHLAKGCPEAEIMSYLIKEGENHGEPEHN